MSLADKVATTTLIRAVGVVVLLVTSIVVARELGPEERGVLGYLILVTTVAVTLASNGLEGAWPYLIAKGQWPREVVLGTARTMAVGIGLVGVLFAALWLTVDPTALWRERAVATALTIAIPLIVGLGNTWRALLFGHMMVTQANAGELCGRLAYLVAVLALAAGGWLDVTACLALTLLLHGTSLMAWMVALPPRGWARFDATFARASFAYIRWVMVGQVATFLLYYLDQALVFWLADERELGLYGVAVTLGQQLWLVSQSTALLHLPMSAGRKADELDRTAELARANALLLMLGIGATAVVAPLVVPWLYGQEYGGSVAMLFALLPGIFAVGVARVVASEISGRGRVHANAAYATIALVANVACNLVLIPALGGVGAALSTSIAYALLAVLVLADYSRSSGIAWHALVVPRRADADRLGRTVGGWIRRAAGYSLGR